MTDNTPSIGYIVGGGLKENLRVRLTVASQEVQEGAFVVIHSAAWREAHPEDPPPLPVKTIPAHHAPVNLAQEGDIAEIFGRPDERGNFVIGYAREAGHG